MAVQSNLCHNCYAIETEENWCYSTFLSWFYSVEWHRDATVALPACNRGATGSYRDITVNNLGNTGVYRHEPWLHRAAP